MNGAAGKSYKDLTRRSLGVNRGARIKGAEMNMRAIADYTLGLAIVLTHLVMMAIRGDRHSVESF